MSEPEIGGIRNSGQFVLVCVLVLTFCCDVRRGAWDILREAAAIRLELGNRKLHWCRDQDLVENLGLC